MPPSDTYVKTYLREGDKRVQKRKTRVAKHSVNPKYNQSLRYHAQEVAGRSLLVMVWERQKGFEHNVPLGVAEISLTQLDRTTVEGWYRLLPASSVEDRDNHESDSAESTR